MAGGGGDDTTVQTTNPWEGQQPYLKDLFGAGQNQFSGGAPSLTQATDLATQAAGQLQQAAGSAGDVAGNAASGLNFLTGGDVLSPSSNPALQQYIDLANQSTTKAFNQNVLPGLKSGAVQAGNVGSSREGIAQGLATQGLTQSLAQQTAGITSAAYGQGLDAFGRGLALAPQTAQLQGASGDFLNQASNAYAGVENLPFEQQRQLLSDYQGIISGNFGGTTSAVGPAQVSGGVSGAVGGGLAGYGATGSPWGAAAGAVAGYFS